MYDFRRDDQGNLIAYNKNTGGIAGRVVTMGDLQPECESADAGKQEIAEALGALMFKYEERFGAVFPLLLMRGVNLDVIASTIEKCLIYGHPFSMDTGNNDY